MTKLLGVKVRVNVTVRWLLFSVWDPLTFRPLPCYDQCVIGHAEYSLETIQMSVPVHWHLDSCQYWCLLDLCCLPSQNQPSSADSLSYQLSLVGSSSDNDIKTDY